MVGHGGSGAGLYLADPTSPIPSHCASIVATSTVRVNYNYLLTCVPQISNAPCQEQGWARGIQQFNWLKHIFFMTEHDKGLGKAKKLCLALSSNSINFSITHMVKCSISREYA